ncbi:hypothetical protein MLD38_035260 [Melastoma candidum]|uniref:Uncharacterized protein n=1 Tax=Melastoma candidum TaxID=119954 RepID=A0ACB9MCH3_9MYRT|nr:hypothetical protein MLD38_035260 [Melastoma candidum]
MWGDPGIPTDSFYQIRPECTDVPKTRFKIKAGKTLSPRKWQSRGGVHPSIRGEVWEFLLGCYDPRSTFEQRENLRQQRRVQYAKWKEECHKMFPIIGSGKLITAPIITEDGQPIEDPLVLMQMNLNNVKVNGLDVVRTDRTLVFYEKQENLAKLWDVLAVYAWVDEDIGYCQGMSDICSPMIIVLEDEADAFWCFERLMRKLLLKLVERCARKALLSPLGLAAVPSSARACGDPPLLVRGSHFHVSLDLDLPQTEIHTFIQLLNLELATSHGSRTCHQPWISNLNNRALIIIIGARGSPQKRVEPNSIVDRKKIYVVRSIDLCPRAKKKISLFSMEQT